MCFGNRTQAIWSVLAAIISHTVLSFAFMLKITINFPTFSRQKINQTHTRFTFLVKTKGKRERKAKIECNFELSLNLHIKITSIKGLVGYKITNKQSCG